MTSQRTEFTARQIRSRGWSTELIHRHLEPVETIETRSGFTCFLYSKRDVFDAECGELEVAETVADFYERRARLSTARAKRFRRYAKDLRARRGQVTTEVFDYG